jgi:hypothetical protein
MVLNARDITTNDPVPVFSKDQILLTKNLKTSVLSQSVAMSANAASTVKIDCREYKTITLYGTSTTNNLINVSYSHNNTNFFRTNNKLNMIDIGGFNTFHLTLDHIPNYIRFYNNNGSPITLTLEYVLYN